MKGAIPSRMLAGAEREMAEIAERYQPKPFDPPVKRVRRLLRGGPLNNRRVDCPETLKEFDCSWLTGNYQLQEDGIFRFVQRVNQ